jgi:hypothetical protein
MRKIVNYGEFRDWSGIRMALMQLFYMQVSR